MPMSVWSTAFFKHRSTDSRNRGRISGTEQCYGIRAYSYFLTQYPNLPPVVSATRALGAVIQNLLLCTESRIVAATDILSF